MFDLVGVMKQILEVLKEILEAMKKGGTKK